MLGDALTDDGSEGEVGILFEQGDEDPGGVDGGVPVVTAVEGAGAGVIVDDVTGRVVDPEVVVRVVGRIEGVVDAGEGQSGKGDDEGYVEDGWGDVGQRTEIWHGLFL